MFTIPSNHTWSHHARVEVLPQTSPTDICDIPGFPLISLNTCYICVSQSWDISGFLLISLFAMSGLSSPLSYRYRGHHGTFPWCPSTLCMCPRSIKSHRYRGHLGTFSWCPLTLLCCVDICVPCRSNQSHRYRGHLRTFPDVPNTSLLCMCPRSNPSHRYRGHLKTFPWCP